MQKKKNTNSTMEKQEGFCCGPVNNTNEYVNDVSDLSCETFTAGVGTL